jgi:hypothetical protein
LWNSLQSASAYGRRYYFTTLPFFVCVLEPFSFCPYTCLFIIINIINSCFKKKTQQTAASTSPHPLEKKKKDDNDDNVSLTVKSCDGGILFHWSVSPHRPSAPSEDPSAATNNVTLLALTTWSKELCVPKHDEQHYKSNVHFFADITPCDEPTEKNDDDDAVVTWSIFDLSSNKVAEFVIHTRCNHHEATIVYGNCHGTINKDQPGHESEAGGASIQHLKNNKNDVRSDEIDMSTTLTSSPPNPLSAVATPHGRALYDFYTTYSCSCYSCSCGKGCTTSCCSTCYTYYTYCTAGRYYPNGYNVAGSSCYACPGGQYQSAARATSCKTCSAVCFPFFLQDYIFKDINRFACLFFLRGFIP